ncbi:putative cyclohydrolase [Rhodotorula diobovata]|uniref:GTP cyclohydrolase II n=1 Tax=Rhodotorula diobovata TaxID=5288 RepID=A0A5C5FMV8_9BASI|nr:putative cyclohydrolase [Rhodotorula diobovata]
MLHARAQHSVSPSDLSVLQALTGDRPPSSSAAHLIAAAGPQPSTSASRDAPRQAKRGDRRPPVDPLMIAAAASAGPQVTRNHYFHTFFPQPLAYAPCDDERTSAAATMAQRPKMESRQAPRTIRLQVEDEERRRKERLERLRDEQVAKEHRHDERAIADRPQAVAMPTHDGGFEFREDGRLDDKLGPDARRGKPPASAQVHHLKDDALPDLPPLEVQCRVRTRIPTPHGHIFLHLYTNNHDNKEHLAFVADHAQMASTSLTTNAVEGTPVVAETGERRLLPFIRSRTLDSKWYDGETDEERIVRGAYVGRLSATSHCRHAHAPPSAASLAPTDPPLVRIHSECFTGETIGSQRCDCGEQLDEAFRLITLAGRGVVVYLRQEGRGIGLLEKMRAYNLQDLGHDTVTANLMLGHGADMRTYGIAGAILRDLGVAQSGVRLLTNNPDKIRQIEGEGVSVVERVAMDAPYGSGEEDDDSDGGSSTSDAHTDSSVAYHLRRAGVGMIGASTTSSPELDKYLRTKIERMGHMLTAPEQQAVRNRVMSGGGSSGSAGAHPLSESTSALPARDDVAEEEKRA